MLTGGRMMLRRFPSGMCFARAQGRFPNVGRHCNGCHRWPASYGHSRLRERGWRKRVGAWVSTGRSSRGSESTSPSTCRRPRVAVHVSPSTCRCPRVAVHGSLSTRRCPRVAVHGSMSTCRCPRVAVHVSMFPGRSFHVAVHLPVVVGSWADRVPAVGGRRRLSACVLKAEETRAENTIHKNEKSPSRCSSSSLESLT